MSKRRTGIVLALCLCLVAFLLGYVTHRQQPKIVEDFPVEFCVPVHGSWNVNTYYDSASVECQEDGYLTVYIRHYRDVQASVWRVPKDAPYSIADIRSEYEDRVSGSITYECVVLDVGEYTGDVTLRAQFEGLGEKEIHIEVI